MQCSQFDVAVAAISVSFATLAAIPTASYLNEILIQKTDALSLADPSATVFPSGAPFETRRAPFPGTDCASQAKASSELIQGRRTREIGLMGYPIPQQQSARCFFSALPIFPEKSVQSGVVRLTCRQRP